MHAPVYSMHIYAWKCAIGGVLLGEMTGLGCFFNLTSSKHSNLNTKNIKTLLDFSRQKYMQARIGIPTLQFSNLGGFIKAPFQVDMCAVDKQEAPFWLS